MAKRKRGRLNYRPLYKGGGAEGDRTPDLMNAIHARSQLRYSPTDCAGL